MFSDLKGESQSITNINEPESLCKWFSNAVQIGLQHTHGGTPRQFATTCTYNNLDGTLQLTVDITSAHNFYEKGMKLVCLNIPQGTPIVTGNIIDDILSTVHFSQELSGEFKRGGHSSYPIAAAKTTTLATVDPNDANKYNLTIEQKGLIAPFDGIRYFAGDIISWLDTTRFDTPRFRVIQEDFVLEKKAGSTAVIKINGPNPSTTLPIGTAIDISFRQEDEFQIVEGTTRYCLAIDPTSIVPDLGLRAGQILTSSDTSMPTGISIEVLDITDDLTKYHPIISQAYNVDTVNHGAMTAYSENVLGDGSNSDVYLAGVSPGAGGSNVTISFNPLAAPAIALWDRIFVGQTVTLSNAYAGSSLALGTTVIAKSTEAADPRTVTLSNTLTLGVGSPTTTNIIRFTTSFTVTSQESKYIWLRKNIEVGQGANSLTGATVWYDGMDIDAHLARVEIEATVPTPPVGQPADLVGFPNNPGDPSGFSNTRVLMSHFQDIGGDPLYGSGGTNTDQPVSFRNQPLVSNSTRARDSFQSTFEILGGCFENRGNVPGLDAASQFANLKALFGTSAIPDRDDTNPNAPKFTYQHDGYYKANLTSEENIYLRTDVNATAFQSSGYDTGQSTQVASSQILAKIPMNNPTFAPTLTFDLLGTNADKYANIYDYERPSEVIYYTDNGNNIFSIMLQSKKISHIRLYVTDKFGRLIPANSQEQIECGGLSFNATLRIDTYEKLVTPEQN